MDFFTISFKIALFSNLPSVSCEIHCTFYTLLNIYYTYITPLIHNITPILLMNKACQMNVFPSKQKPFKGYTLESACAWILSRN